MLLVTARAGADDLHTALDVGADDYLARPTTPPQFWARVAIAERRSTVEYLAGVPMLDLSAEYGDGGWVAGRGAPAYPRRARAHQIV